MRRRPQRNPRRGILRATAAVVVLVILLFAAILITSSLTAPPATAPTVPTAPATPGPSTTAPRGTATPTVTSKRAAPTPTPSKKKHAALGTQGPGAGDDVVFRDAGSAANLAALARQPMTQVKNQVVTRDGRSAAYFLQRGDAYSRNPLVIEQRSTHRRLQMGYGDPFVRPVWSADGRYLLYVRVEQTRALPEARWSLVELDTASRRNVVLDRENALDLIPLGWSRGSPLFLVVSSIDTSLFTMASGHPRFVSIVIPQAVTSALLSPDGRYIAFAVPTNCGYCTVDLYDLAQSTVSNGPSGMPNERAMLWTRDGSQLVVQMHDQLALVTSSSLATDLVAAPAGLPDLSVHPMSAVRSGGALTLVDLATGRTYRSAA